MGWRCVADPCAIFRFHHTQAVAILEKGERII